MGRSRSMSVLASAMAWSWSGVSMNGKASSKSRCAVESGPKAMPVASSRAA